MYGFDKQQQAKREKYKLLIFGQLNKQKVKSSTEKQMFRRLNTCSDGGEMLFKHILYSEIDIVRQ